jgi:hypothetical protein
MQWCSHRQSSKSWIYSRLIDSRTIVLKLLKSFIPSRYKSVCCFWNGWFAFLLVTKRSIWVWISQYFLKFVIVQIIKTVNSIKRSWKMKGQFSFNFRSTSGYNVELTSVTSCCLWVVAVHISELLRCTSNERFSAFHPFLIYVRATRILRIYTYLTLSTRILFGNCRCNAMMFELHEVEGMILSKI